MYCVDGEVCADDGARLVGVRHAGIAVDGHSATQSLHAIRESGEAAAGDDPRTTDAVIVDGDL